MPTHHCHDCNRPVDYTLLQFHVESLNGWLSTTPLQLLSCICYLCAQTCAWWYAAFISWFCNCRSNKLDCPAKVLLSGIVESDVLVVQSLSLNHTCSVEQHYFVYPEVRNNIAPADQSTIATLTNFTISATQIAMYLREKGYTNVTQKDVANWRAKLQHCNSPKAEDEVSVCLFKYISNNMLHTSNFLNKLLDTVHFCCLFHVFFIMI